MRKDGGWKEANGESVATSNSMDEAFVGAHQWGTQDLNSDPLTDLPPSPSYESSCMQGRLHSLTILSRPVNMRKSTDLLDKRVPYTRYSESPTLKKRRRQSSSSYYSRATLKGSTPSRALSSLSTNARSASIPTERHNKTRMLSISQATTTDSTPPRRKRDCISLPSQATNTPLRGLRSPSASTVHYLATFQRRTKNRSKKASTRLVH